ncbi:MAG: preprotein translocase subunit YajC [Clostridiales bacterium]|jgi:preprotein translocase subunit YajC|nr:preprotein translocase subunit YajC [Clostridiales bacterium]
MNFSLLNQLAGFSNLFLSNSSADSNAEAVASAGGTLVFQLITFGIVILFFYFVIIRPQKRKEKEAQTMRDSVQIGDEIVTIGGIVGLVIRKSEDTLLIETGGEKNKIRIKTWAVQENVTANERAKAETSKVSKVADKISKGEEK